MRGWVGLLAATGIAGTVTAQPLPPERVVLTAVGTGMIHSAPDEVVQRLTAIGSGTTIQDAIADRDRKLEEIRQRLKAMGLAGAIAAAEPSAADLTISLFAAPNKPGAPQRAQGALVVTLARVDQAAAVREALGKDGLLTQQTPPELKLRDPGPAHRAAIAAAVAAARRDADAYAAALGLTIVGMTKVSNAIGIAPLIESVSKGFGPGGLRETQPVDVVSEARVQIDFVARSR